MLSFLFHFGSIIFLPFFIFLFRAFLKKYLVFILACLFFTYTSFALNDLLEFIYHRGVVYFNHLPQDRLNLISSHTIIFSIILVCGSFQFWRFGFAQKVFYILSFFGFSLYLSLLSYPIIAYRFFEQTIFSYFLWVDYLQGYSRWFCLSLMFLYGIYFFTKSVVFGSLFDVF